MVFAITAEFVHGTYQGGLSSGDEPEWYPTPLRLYSALVSTACLTFGLNRPVKHEGMSDSGLRSALKWLEGRPPTSIIVPPTVGRASKAKTYSCDTAANAGDIVKRRNMRPRMARPVIPLEQDAERGLLLTWIWDEEPDPETFHTLSRLCEETPYLGGTESPVALAAHHDYKLPENLEEHTWNLSHESVLKTMYRPGARIIEYPTEGRLEDLDEAYDNGTPLPSTTYGVGYVPATPPKKTDAPWTHAYYVEVDSPQWRPREDEQVEWAVAMHKLLVRQWGVVAPIALTGRAFGNVERPANNVAIHPFTPLFKNLHDQQLTDHVAALKPGFLILIPDDMEDGDALALARIIIRLKGMPLWRPGRREDTIMLGRAVSVDPTRLWKPVPEHHVRVWKPFPLAVAEVPTSKNQDGRWGARENMLLAIAHVWRGRYQQDGLTGRNRYRHLVEQVENDPTVRVCAAISVHRPNMGGYAHHMQSCNIAHGMTGLIRFRKDRGLDECAMAIGQSRHLGGGLLTPVDLDVETEGEAR